MAGEWFMNEEHLTFAHHLADAAGAAIMPFYRRRLAVENKGSADRFDPVTAADRAAESAMRSMISERYPQHGVIGEEFGSERSEAEFVWVLDPVDGTKSFMTGIPLWGTLIALLHNGKPVLGIADHPFLGERFWGDGLDAFSRSNSGTGKLSTRHPVALSDAVICVGSSAAFVPHLHQRLSAIAPCVRMIRYGADCYDTCMLAEGHIDAILHQGLDIYDIAAVVPIIEGAGGVITGLDGSPAISASAFLAAGDRHLHAQLLTRLSAA